MRNDKWVRVLAGERSFARRSAIAISISLVGYGIVFAIHVFTGVYISALTIVTVILIALCCGSSLGLLSAVTLSVLSDYYFIPPIGSVFDNREGFEHFFILTLLTVFVSYLGSALRSAFERVVLAKQEAEAAKQEAEISTAMMEKVLALVSHDIRNPLWSIKLSSQLILRTPGQSDKHQPILARIQQTIEHADSMIQSLLDVSRIRSGKLINLDFQSCDLSTKLAEIVEEMSLVNCDRLTLKILGPVWGDWGMNGIRRVLENLVANAMKYGDPNAPIDITLEQSNGQAIVSVHNQGKEISVADQNTLFDSFHRTYESENSSIRGWGLGLALVKGVAEAHGGSVAVKSTADQGTTFILSLPIRKLAQRQPETTKSVTL